MWDWRIRVCRVYGEGIGEFLGFIKQGEGEGAEAESLFDTNSERRGVEFEELVI